MQRRMRDRRGATGDGSEAAATERRGGFIAEDELVRKDCRRRCVGSIARRRRRAGNGSVRAGRRPRADEFEGLSKPRHY